MEPLLIKDSLKKNIIIPLWLWYLHIWFIHRRHEKDQMLKLYTHTKKQCHHSEI